MSAPFNPLATLEVSDQTRAMAIEEENLNGKFLIAMPGMEDTRFDHSLIYICAHSSQGTMGLIVNKPSQDVKLASLLKQLEIPRGELSDDIRVHFGGPVEHGRGFVLHSKDYHGGDMTLEVDDNFGMTATLSILEDMSVGQGPEKALLALGYAGWGPGQLENEILANGWLTSEACPEIVFQEENGGKWKAALAKLGVSPMMLSSTAGNA